MSGETSGIRAVLVPDYIKPEMMGVDLGYGGDPLLPTSIAMDMPEKYTNVGEGPQHLRGDARSLYWFRDGVLDYVYSSHLLEDFPPEETEAVMREWVRVLKPGGLLALYLPNEQRYRAWCEKHGVQRNLAHRCLEMSVEYMLPLVERVDCTPIATHDDAEAGGYCFLVVGRKR